jgi:HlyD family secretion protein
MRTRTMIGGGMAAFAALAALAAFTLYGGEPEQPAYRTETVERGELRSVISASGTLNAVVMVEIGSQVSGQVLEILADYNSKVTANQVIARLDPAKMESKVREQEAQLALARASVGQQEAAVARTLADGAKARANALQAKNDLARKKSLKEQGFVSNADMDKAVQLAGQTEAELRSNEAQLKMAEAQVLTARAEVQQREASLQSAKLDLGYTVIRSPVDGVVVERATDVGQTVAASLQAPKLFKIAGDLKKMQVEVAVDEADIGRVRDGQDVRFTVDSFPGREFTGNVRQIRLAPQVVQNVTTYVVVVTANNDALLLMPGMTANVRIVVAQREDALKVPNAALRFRPQAAAAPGASAAAPAAAGPGRGQFSAEESVERLTRDLALTEQQQAKARELFAKMGETLRTARQQGASPQDMREQSQRLRQQTMAQLRDSLTEAQRAKLDQLRARRGPQRQTAGRVYVMHDDGALQAVEVRLGLDDGTATEIVAGDLKPGDKVVIGTEAAKRAQQAGGLRGGLRL